MIKWLQYFKENFQPSEKFLMEMDSQIRPKVESDLGRKINWDKLWYFVEPMDDKFVIRESKNQLGMKMLILFGKIKFGSELIHLDINWYVDKGDEYVMFRDSLVGKSICFDIEKIADEFDCLKYFPIIGDDHERKVLFKNKIFKVFSVYNKYPHEGELFIKSDPTSLKIISDSLHKSQALWNSDEAIFAYPSAEERGKFHSLSFDRVEGESLVFYFDFGSSHDNSMKFILNQLAKLDCKIEEVEIKYLGI